MLRLFWSKIWRWKTCAATWGKAGREKFEKEFTLEVFEKRMTWILEHIVYPLFSKMGIERD